MRSPHIDQTQHKGGEGEGAQSQRGRIGEFAIRDLLVGTRLEFTAEGRETILGGIDMGQWAIAETSSCLGSRMLFRA